MGAYAANSISAGQTVVLSGGLNASLSAAGNAVTQLGMSGKVDPNQLAASAALGGIFGSGSGLIGVLGTDANQALSQAAFNNSVGRFLNMTDAEIAATDAAAPAAWNAATQAAALTGADQLGSPEAQPTIETWLDKMFGLDSDDNGDNGNGCE